MNNGIISYFIESGISLVLLYFFYWILLRKETFFSLNRLILLGSVLFSFLLPFFNISVQVSNNIASLLLNLSARIGNIIELPEVVVNADEYPISQFSLHWREVVFYVYIVGVIILSLNLFSGFFKLYFLLKTRSSRKFSKYALVSIDQNLAPFSFLNRIFVNRSLINENQLDEIIEHECVHIRQRHTIDVLFMEFFLIIQWFNPFMWLFRKSLKETHEYLADTKVIKKGYNQMNYQTLLLDQIKGLNAIGLTNNFNRSLIKKRIVMMTKTKSAKLSVLKHYLLIPVLLAIVMVFACSKYEELQTTEKSKEVATIDGEPIFFIVEDMPKFELEGYEESNEFGAFMRYIKNELRYPEKAKEDKISGRVFVQFIVRTDGSLDQVKVGRGVSPELDAEAIRVVESSPKWIPGKQRGRLVNVAFTFPIVFEL